VKSQEAIKLEAEVSDKIKQLSMSAYEYKREMLRQEVELYRLKGVDTAKIEEYFARQSMENLRTRFGFQKWADFMDNQFKTTIASMKGTLASFFDDAYLGELKKGKEYFADFGKSILKMFSQMISEMITRWVMFGSMIEGKGGTGSWLGIVGSLASLFGGIKGGGKYAGTTTSGYYSGGGFTGMQTTTMHQGGIIRAHGGLAIDEVPIIAQSGERVLSRRQNANYEQGQQPVYVFIQSWDASDFIRNRKMIEGIISNALRMRTSLREDIRHA